MDASAARKSTSISKHDWIGLGDAPAPKTTRFRRTAASPRATLMMAWPRTGMPLRTSFGAFKVSIVDRMPTSNAGVAVSLELQSKKQLLFRI
jgi:hypothetical protein